LFIHCPTLYLRYDVVGKADGQNEAGGCELVASRLADGLCGQTNDNSLLFICVDSSLLTSMLSVLFVYSFFLSVLTCYSFAGRGGNIINTSYEVFTFGVFFYDLLMDKIRTADVAWWHGNNETILYCFF
jgi:hypothetical protein